MKFDVVCFFQVLEHLECPEIFLKDIGTILQPQGYIFSINSKPGKILDYSLKERVGIILLII